MRLFFSSPIAVVLLLLSLGEAVVGTSTSDNGLRPVCEWQRNISIGLSPSPATSGAFWQTPFGFSFTVACFAYDWRLSSATSGTCEVPEGFDVQARAAIHYTDPTTGAAVRESYPLDTVFGGSARWMRLTVPDTFTFPYGSDSYVQWAIEYYYPSLPRGCGGLEVRESITAGVSSLGPFATTVNHANVDAVQPGVVSIGNVAWFHFRRASPFNFSPRPAPDLVGVTPLASYCSSLASATSASFPPVQYGSRASSDVPLEYTWQFNFTNAGVYRLCVREEGSSSYVQKLTFRVFGGDPAYFRSPHIQPGGLVYLFETLSLTFFGEALDAANDCAKVMRSSYGCDVTNEGEWYTGNVRPSCDTNGTALVAGSNGSYPVAPHAPVMTTWSFELTMGGSYKVCYRRGDTPKWISVGHYDELNQHAKDWHHDQDDNLTTTSSSATEVSTPLSDDDDEEGFGVTRTPTDQDSTITEGARRTMTAAAATTTGDSPTTTPVVVCFVHGTTTSSSSSSSESESDSDLAATYSCSAATPVCCGRGCCFGTDTCVDGRCTAPGKAGGGGGTNQQQCPTAPANFPGYAGDVETVLLLDLSTAVLPPNFSSNLGVVLCTPPEALTVLPVVPAQAAEDETGGRRQQNDDGGDAMSIQVYIDCGVDLCDSVERMNYALWLYKKNPDAFSHLHVRGVGKALDGDGGITTGGNNNNAATKSPSTGGGGSANGSETTKHLLVGGIIGCAAFLLLVILIAIILRHHRQIRRDRAAAGASAAGIVVAVDHPFDGVDVVATRAERSAAGTAEEEMTTPAAAAAVGYYFAGNEGNHRQGAERRDEDEDDVIPVVVASVALERRKHSKSPPPLPPPPAAAEAAAAAAADFSPPGTPDTICSITSKKAVVDAEHDAVPPPTAVVDRAAATTDGPSPPPPRMVAEERVLHDDELSFHSDDPLTLDTAAVALDFPIA